MATLLTSHAGPTKDLSFINTSPQKYPPKLSHFQQNLPLKSKRCSMNYRSSPIKNAMSSISNSNAQVEENTDEACELVNGIELALGEGEDAFRCYLLTAVKNNNGRGILLLTDVFGFEDSSTRDFAYRISCSGYNVLVPDLFHGMPWIKGRPQSDYEAWRSSHPTDRLSKDIQTSTKWMTDEFTAAGCSSDKLGIVGFCFGGGWLIKTLASDEQQNFATGVCFYGTRIDPTLAERVKVPVLFIAGDNDPLCQISTIEEMARQIRESQVRVYPGRGHAFAHRPESAEDDADAEKAFVLARNWLHDKLVVQPIQV